MLESCDIMWQSNDLKHWWSWLRQASGCFFVGCQVFNKDELLPLLCQLQSLKKQGKPTVAMRKLRVLPNSTSAERQTLSATLEIFAGTVCSRVITVQYSAWFTVQYVSLPATWIIWIGIEVGGALRAALMCNCFLEFNAGYWNKCFFTKCFFASSLLLWVIIALRLVVYNDKCTNFESKLPKDTSDNLNKCLRSERIQPNQWKQSKFQISWPRYLETQRPSSSGFLPPSSNASHTTE